MVDAGLSEVLGFDPETGNRVGETTLPTSDQKGNLLVPEPVQKKFEEQLNERGDAERWDITPQLLFRKQIEQQDRIVRRQFFNYNPHTNIPRNWDEEISGVAQASENFRRGSEAAFIKQPDQTYRLASLYYSQEGGTDSMVSFGPNHTDYEQDVALNLVKTIGVGSNNLTIDFDTSSAPSSVELITRDGENSPAQRFKLDKDTIEQAYREKGLSLTIDGDIYEVANDRDAGTPLRITHKTGDQIKDEVEIPQHLEPDHFNDPEIVDENLAARFVPDPLLRQPFDLKPDPKLDFWQKTDPMITLGIKWNHAASNLQTPPPAPK